MPADDSPDMEKLAGQYMDLWQKQLQGMASDPQMSDLMARTMELMNAGAGTYTAAMRQAADVAGQAAKDNENSHAPATTDASGTQTSAAAHGDTNGDMAELTRRVAVLEDRIIALESQLKSGSGRAGAGSKRSPRKKPKSTER